MRPDERDLDDEIRGHLALAIQERVDRGEDPDAARLAALAELGYVPAVRESIRQVWFAAWRDAVADLTADIRYAVRNLRTHRAFALTVTAVLTLGIGLNAAVFTMLKGVALEPLSGVADGPGIAVAYAESSTGRAMRFSYPDYARLRDGTRSFASVFGFALAEVTLGRGRDARVVSAELVTGSYFSALGVTAALGRTLTPDDEVAPGRHPVVVLSDGIWRRDFAADPDIVGRTVEINRQPLTVVGVTVPGFHGAIVSYDIELFIPVMTAPDLGFTFTSAAPTAAGILADRRATVFVMHGYLRPGVTREAAATELNAVWAADAGSRPADAPAAEIRVVPFLRAPGTGPTYILPTLTALATMGLLVLLITCANLAGLVLVRGLSRRGEIAVRLALGATRQRVVRLLVLENLVLAIPGGVFGLLLSWSGIPPMVAYAERLAAPQRLHLNVEVDALVIGFTALVAGGCALVFGFVPALRSSRVALVTALNEDAAPRGAARGRFRASLVVAQVAVSLMLLIGAGLAIRGVDAARRADPGFDTDGVAVVALNVKPQGYDGERGRRFYRELLDRARAGAGVESATLAEHTPLGLLDTRSERAAVDGYAPARGEDLAFMSNTVGPDYFRTLRIALAAGREFVDGDDEASAPVVVVNRTLAERFFGSPAAALGQRVRLGEGAWRTVVGVAADVKYARINEAPRPYVYLPFFQAYKPTMQLHVRGPGSVDARVAQARGVVEALDPDLPIPIARSLARSTTGAFLFFDLLATMLPIFGAVGLVLAALGTYGLVAYAVRQSTREIGIRLALGASRGSIVRRYVGRGLRLGVAGALVGLVAALAVTRLLGSVVYGVGAADAGPFTLGLAVVLTGVAAATVVPAWRAARTDPLGVLRHQ
ncbi:MAG: ADOP family duplicated permease [Vicinamibacterales bacterium]